MSMESLLFLAWLHVYCRDFTFGNLSVIQDPEKFTPQKGESITMDCSWDTMNARRIRVEWIKYPKSHTLDDNKTGMERLFTGLWESPDKGNTFILMNQNRSSYNLTNNTSVLTLESITEEDEGLYVCKVVFEIPILISGVGNGTLIQVHNIRPVSGHPGYHLLAIISLFPVVILVAYFIWKIRKRPKRRILQKIEQESEEMNHPYQNNDDDNASSNNSVTWAVSTLYESFDYFAMKNNDEKCAASSDQYATCSGDPAACYVQIDTPPDGGATCSDKAATCLDNEEGEETECKQTLIPAFDK